MTIFYALLSITCGAILAALAWVEFGPLLALIVYAVAGSVVLLGAAAVIAVRPGISSVLHAKSMKTGGNSTAS